MVFGLLETRKKQKSHFGVNLTTMHIITPMETVVSLSGHDCNECLHNDGFVGKLTLYVRAYITREKFSNSVVVLRVVALKCSQPQSHWFHLVGLKLKSYVKNENKVVMVRC